MKTLSIAVVISAVILSQQVYAIDMKKEIPLVVKESGYETRKIQADIDANRDKIIEENKVMAVDRRRLKEAGKISDKAKIEQIKQDIRNREAVVKNLKKEIRNKVNQKDRLLGNGPINMEERDVKH